MNNNVQFISKIIKKSGKRKQFLSNLSHDTLRVTHTRPPSGSQKPQISGAHLPNKIISWTIEMEVNSNYRTLGQYCAANVDRGESKGILDGLEDVNYKLPTDLPLEHYSLLGSTPLHLAFYYKNLNDIETLIKRGADFTLKNGHNRTVLHNALQSDCVWFEEKGRILREKVVIDPNISTILSAHAEYNISEDPSDECGISHFHIACITNHVKAVSTFLKGGVSANKAIEMNSKLLPGYTPLHIAASYHALETIELLLEHNADIGCKDAKGMTALHLLIDRNMKLTNSLDAEKPAMYKKLKTDIEINEKIIDMLLAKSNVQDRTGLSPLQIACTMQEPSRAKELLATADLQYAVSTDSIMWPGYTALHFAAHFNIDIVKTLLENQANILAKDAKKVTPFELCVENYKIEEIYYLIIEEQNLRNIKFSDGKTKLSSFVMAMHNERAFESFIKKISDLSIYIPFDSPLWPGYTVFHLAIVFLEKEEETLENFIENTDYYYRTNEDWEMAEGKKTEKAGSIVEEIKVKLNLEDIKLCLKKGVDITAQDIQGRTPLHLAFRLQSKNLVDRLLSAQKRVVNPVDDEGLSHLHIAIASGKEVLAKELLRAPINRINESVKIGFPLHVVEYHQEKKEHVRKRIDINAGSTALHIAVAKCNPRITKLLIDSGADLYARDECGLTPIHLMMCFTDGFDTSGFECILEAIEDLEDRVVDSTGLSHLHVACYLGWTKVVKNLLDRGAKNLESAIIANDSSPPFLKQLDKMRPLGLAFMCMWIDVIELLVDRGAEICLHRTIVNDLGRKKIHEWVDKLKKNRALRGRFERETGVTLLHFACASLNVEVVKEALDEGADVNSQTRENSPFWPGFTPLHVLATPSQPDHERLVSLVKLLLSRGADVTLKNAEQQTPIHLFHNTNRSDDTNIIRFARRVHQQIVVFLLEAERDFNVKHANRVGISHFHVACQRDCEEIVKQFLDHGVDLNKQVDYMDFAHDGGCSPLHLSLTWSEKSYDLLLNHGADVRLVDRLGDTALHRVTGLHPIDLELMEKIISLGADVMAANVYGETPFEALLDEWDMPTDMIETMMNKGIPANSFNPVSEEGYLAIAFHSIRVIPKVTVSPIFDVMMSRHDLTVVDDMGRNAIHNLVSKKSRELSCDAIVEQYSSATHRLMRRGCNVDHQDKKGRTPLHMATQLRNSDGIVALFDCGANVNVVDENQKSALAYALEYDEDEAEDVQDNLWIFYAYLNRYCSYGFELSEMNVELHRKIGSICVLTDEYWVYDLPPLDEEIEKLKKWRIGSSSMKLHALLKNEGVATYTMMNRDYRLAVDEIFQSDRLRKEVPKATGLLLLRYNQARIDFQTRLTLIEPAKVALDVLAAHCMPDVCAFIILGFLTVKELQNMIASASDIE